MSNPSSAADLLDMFVKPGKFRPPSGRMNLSELPNIPGARMGASCHQQGQGDCGNRVADAVCKGDPVLMVMLAILVVLLMVMLIAALLVTLTMGMMVLMVLVLMVTVILVMLAGALGLAAPPAPPPARFVTEPRAAFPEAGQEPGLLTHLPPPPPPAGPGEKSEPPIPLSQVRPLLVPQGTLFPLPSSPSHER
ncbi:unnamed protein product [Rangifer tarandus platyrhynchus]|uniref:Uncharacterized protein n=1 Tax=Rangifer tarandus platyrhynchus TaxID=3082113 RepID=A0ABN8YVJ1_RANTA|nr:unnamed protein product [Rangifer tarandus platyrhynchus]